MYAFAYWHTYFDSLFLRHPIRPSLELYHDLNITPLLAPWPSLHLLPQLPSLLDILERFILDQDNWVGCMCSQEEMQAMQSSINTLVLCLQCEKQYGLQFWPTSRRRIQASIMHFFILLKRFILAIVPESCKNLVETHRADKLSIEMAKIQYFINEIIAVMEPVHSFLFGEEFQEEQHLTKAFFEEFNMFIQNLPRIKRSHLARTPKLMDYICVVNPIEAEGLQLPKDDQVRRKSATVLERPRSIKKYSIQKKKRNKNFKVVNNSIIKDNHHSLQKNTFERDNQAQLQHYQFFKFKDKVRKYSFYNKSKKQTLASIQTKEKTASVEKDRSRSHDRSLSISPEVKLKSRTLANNRGYEESPMIDRRSGEFTSRTIMTRRSRSFRRADIFQAEQVQHERQEKTKKKKVLKHQLNSQRYSQLINLQEGKVKGWALVREYIMRRVAERRLKRLLL